MNIFLKFIGLILNLLFPPKCEFCSEILEWNSEHKYGLCQKCFKQVSFIGENACNYCGKEIKSHEGNVCGKCTNKKSYFKVLSACEYTGLSREKLLEFKFKGKKELAKIFSLFIIEKLKMTNLKEFDIIISVPIHFSKLNQRGYNQSELIARNICKYFSKPISAQSLIKKKHTESQSKLDRRNRDINVRGTFEVLDNQKFLGKRVLLVDDIITTGATADECSKVLMQAGASRVYVATIAAGKNNVD